MKDTILIIALITNPLMIILAVVGINIHFNIVKENRLIAQRTSNFKSTEAVVNKYIIRYFEVSANGSASNRKSTSFYNSYIDVNYTVDSRTIHSFGMLNSDSILEQALMRYESIPGSPPLYYQQPSDRLYENTYSILKDFHTKKNNYSTTFNIKYLPENPVINELNTRWKRSYGLPFFFYGFSCLFLLIYFLFSHLSKIKLGNAIYQPLLISACIILAFVVFKITNNKVSIDRKKLSEAGLEIQLFETDTQSKLSQYFLKYRN